MVWKSGSWDAQSNYSPRTEAQYTHLSPSPVSQKPSKPVQEGSLIAAMGTSQGLVFERLYSLDHELLGYNAQGGKVLIRLPQNDSAIDQYIGLSFTKGVTERETGRTLLILGSNAHHIDAMQNQFSNVLWTKTDEEEIKKFGDTIRWVNVGDTKNGFLGIDYNPSATVDAGVARTPKDIQFLSQTLLDYGYDSAKRLFLLRPPYIQERPEGKVLRREGLENLSQIAKADKSKLAKILRNKAFDVEIEEEKR